MSSTYSFLLQDDSGRTITSLSGYYFFSYSRSTRGLSVLEMGFPLDVFEKQVFPLFQVDRRVDVWRSPATGIPMRREGVYLLRKWRINTRESDSMDIVTIYCRDAKDLLNRRQIIQAAGTSFTYKTDTVDDMMKAIVREQMLEGSCTDVDGVLDPTRAWPAGEFSVQEDLSLGPIITRTFAEGKVMDVLKDLSDISFRKADEDPSNNKIYFDIVPFGINAGTTECIMDETDPTLCILDESGFSILDEGSTTTQFLSNGIGFRFETFAGLRGIDRTNALVFSIKNNNLKDPNYSMDHLDEANSVIVKGFGRGDSRAWSVVDSDAVLSSRWNRSEIFEDASTEPDQANLSDYAYQPLNKNKAKEELNFTFLNTPGSADTPRSLYQVDWDLGDLVPVEYAGKRFNAEINIIYVAMNENGEENITGRNDINASNQ